MSGLWLALGFLTAIPARSVAPQPGDLGRAAFWFSLVGLLLGGLIAGAKCLLDLFFPPFLTAALSVALWAALTGALHLDGLADCCDGLLAVASPERRLEIMRDPHLGAFGVVGLILYLLLKVGAVQALPACDWVPFLLAAATARWLILPVARQPNARPGGLGADFALGLTRRALVLAALFPLALLLFGGVRAVLATGLAGLMTFGVARLARTRLGGVTGDVFGLNVELAELAVLLTYAVQR
jgi:adenosylcobinamide-GDP ribazoletransferase